jgi:hypothetical protein
VNVNSRFVHHIRFAGRFVLVAGTTCLRQKGASFNILGLTQLARSAAGNKMRKRKPQNEM